MNYLMKRAHIIHMESTLKSHKRDGTTERIGTRRNAKYHHSGNRSRRHYTLDNVDTTREPLKQMHA